MSMNLGTATAYIDLDASKFKSGMQGVTAGLKTFNDSTLSAGDRFKALGSTLSSVGRGLTTGVTLPLAGVGVASSKAAIDFESAFAGVRKTVDASEKDLKKIETGIRDMAKEMPTAATEIAGVAEAAGQLGIKTPDILDFTKTMVMLGDSTNLSAEEAATSLAKFANVTKMSMDDIDRLGSTVVALGNNLATTEKDIVSMSLRLGAAGTQIGLSQDQILSFAGALSSVGIEAEMGGSAFSKLMIEMQLATEKGGESLEQFANVAGMSGEQFKKAFQEDATTAIMAFLEGLGTAEERGQSAIGILADMGIEEVRLRDTILRAANAHDVFGEALKIGAEGWKENTALVNEANQRYETTKSKLEILKNNFIEVGISIGEQLLPYIQQFVEWLQGLVQKFQELSPETKDFIVKAGLIAAALGPVLMIVGNLIQFVGSASFAFQGLSGIFGGTGAAAAGLAGVIGPVLTGALVLMMAKIGESEGALSFLQDKFGGLGTVIGGVCEFMAGIWNLTVDNILAKGGLLFDTLDAMIDGPGGATVKDAWDKHNKKIEEIGNRAWDNLTMTTTRELSQQKNSVDKETKEAADKAKTNTDKMAKDMGDNSKKAAQEMSQNMQKTSRVVMDESGKIPKDVQSNMQKSVQAMRQAGSDIYNGMNISFSKLASQGKQHFTDLYNGTTRSSSQMTSKVIADWNRIKSALSGTITGNVQIKVHGVQAALNQIASVKNAARTRSYEPMMPQAFALTRDNSDIMQAYDLVRSDDIASYVTSTIPNKIDLNLGVKDKKKQAPTQNFNFEFKVDKLVAESKENANKFADEVIDRVIYKIKREKRAFGGV
ncbi:phage tail tape measure protein [[Clostridium] sordellii]|uniref:phage tail tape measure protein n=1 Tax=Paraclostridium sordellii TaxID=1505 RepID=UPI0005DB15E2|nr:phage tail tape measure protein [Paeniclostridium sordellii]CEO04858.1 phage tail tape measure protein [[Clostridium] sordellii] [Paeniclostridium sordellii]